MKPLHFLVVVARRSFRDRAATLLFTVDGREVFGRAMSAAGALEQLKGNAPDLARMVPHLRGLSGCAEAGRIL
jgi:hypothetical protein